MRNKKRKDDKWNFGNVIVELYISWARKRVSSRFILSRMNVEELGDQENPHGRSDHYGHNNGNQRDD